MNRFIAVGIASTLAFTPFGVAAFAADMHGAPTPSHFNRHDDSGDSGDTLAPDAGDGAIFHATSVANGVSSAADWRIRHWKGRQFEVMPVAEIDSNGEAAAVVAEESRPRQVKALQAAIEHNHALTDRLAAENVDIHNIVDAQAAMDGKITFYVR